MLDDNAAPELRFILQLTAVEILHCLRNIRCVYFEPFFLYSFCILFFLGMHYFTLIYRTGPIIFHMILFIANWFTCYAERACSVSAKYCKAEYGKLFYMALRWLPKQRLALEENCNDNIGHKYRKDCQKVRQTFFFQRAKLSDGKMNDGI